MDTNKIHKVNEYLDSLSIPRGLNGYSYLQRAILNAEDMAGHRKMNGLWEEIGQEEQIRNSAVVASVRYAVAQSGCNLKLRQIVKDGIRHIRDGTA